MKHEDFLVEIHTEELPPKAILNLGEAFAQQIQERLQKADLSFDAVKFFATPRRLAVLINKLADSQPSQVIDRKGPALNAAFDAAGKPSPACVGFAKSCGVTPAELTTIKNQQGEWVAFRQKVDGKSVEELLPGIVEQAATVLPIPKRMRWGDNDAQFTRPIHSVIMLYGNEVISGKILGYSASKKTRGHRFLAPDWIDISSADKYEAILEKANVIADFSKRREKIRELANQKAAEISDAQVVFSDDLLDEVTGLVEWPIALCGQFDKAFLNLPNEVLISSMQDHQRYFPMMNKQQKLLANFITISNIESKDATRVTHGNERVLRARLADAAFFYETDKKTRLADRVDNLKGIVFQAKLGTLYDKAERISKLAAFIASNKGVNADHAARAGMLGKADLTTNMVNEFPELQGIMGYYYALQDNEQNEVAEAIKEHYMPRFAGDNLPRGAIGQMVAIADKIDTIIGTFGINQIPTGDKDPYGLRRAALGVLRILLENNISLDLDEILTHAISNYDDKLINKEVKSQVFEFMQERLRSLYQEKGVSADVFSAVSALKITNPLDADQRIKAVQAFKKLTEAETLSIANKRVSNILAKYVDAIEAKSINPAIFDNQAEKELARQLEAKSLVVKELSQTGNYQEVLFQLAELRKPIDDFFDQVMVMTDDKPKRENRILLLSKLRALFLQVADIALLQ